MSDVVVIGGGIVGTAAALFLAEAGASVTLLEAEAVAAAASGRNAGSIQHPLDAARAELYEESVAIHRRFGVIGERAAGLLAVGPDAAEAEVAAFAGLRAEALDSDALRAIEPEAAEGLSGVLLHGTGFPAHPAAATRRLAEEARARGAEIVEGVRATVEVRDGRAVGARGADGKDHASDRVLVAAGPWSSTLIDPGGAWTPVGALWGVTVQVALPPGRRVAHRVEEWDGPFASGVQFEATPLDDVVVLGASRSTATPDEDALAAEILARAARFLPVVAEATTVAVRACARPLTPDGLPLLGPVPGVQGLHVAAGHGAYGISLGPASGRIAADALLDRAPVPAAFRADREALRP
ncbi:MAG TPA: FAD-binding oxidoreductase [Baekduia sp.]|uniref:NAD(P)/FAD-dependent oxidoreductase n=1 Tax=Baekduia sp. TaxID=2600305 RepID=UPI002D7683E1|nr:FAD-binding oxidoreductase [Baekduia sp.]HET6510253.1 FAD-binding oxidoreductase [Baekduia sp.]